MIFPKWSELVEWVVVDVVDGEDEVWVAHAYSRCTIHNAQFTIILCLVSCVLNLNCDCLIDERFVCEDWYVGGL